MPGKHPKISRDHEYKRLGTCSILAALDLQDGHVTARVEDRHRSEINAAPVVHRWKNFNALAWDQLDFNETIY